ncbi:MAG: hypothetical protein QNK11_02355 [Legionella sp.]|nr:hypothetical protein [Legionella sp.]
MLKYCLIMMCGLAVFLSGCSLSPHEDAKRAQAVRACIKQCAIKSASCNQRCSDSCTQCEREVNAEMRKLYKGYVHEQCVQGERVSLQLQSFRDPLQCRKTSCNCPEDYRICAGNCRGNIKKYLQVTPFCC